MSDRSSIEWCDATWNPIRYTDDLSEDPQDQRKTGHYCQKISPGCDNCYASKLQPRYFGNEEYGPANTAALYFAHSSVAEGALYLDERTLEQPLHWKRPRRIFVCSMTDIAGEWVPDAWLDRLWAVMATASQHTYLVLTKRPNRLREYLSDPIRLQGGVLAMLTPPNGRSIDLEWTWPLSNVWLGVSIEEDRYAWRAKVLAKIPAAVRFVSAEPLLGPLPSLPLEPPYADWPLDLPRNPLAIYRARGADGRWYLRRYQAIAGAFDWQPWENPIAWLIVGGESGGAPERALVERCTCTRGWQFTAGRQVNTTVHHAERCAVCDGTGWRPKPEALVWARDLRDRAQAAGAAFFFKAWGGQTFRSGGRLLDGREWNGFPESVLAEVQRG